MVAGVELTDAPTGAESDAQMKPKTLAASARAALGLPNPKATSAEDSSGDDIGAIRKKAAKMAESDDAKKRAQGRKILESL